MTGLNMGFFAIPVLDMKVAKSFYGPVMGWTFNERDSDFNYLFVGDDMIGALESATKTFTPSSGGPLMYFRTEKMSPTLQKVSDSGGAVIESLAMEGGARGYTAKITDPFGNTIGFWAPEE